MPASARATADDNTADPAPGVLRGKVVDARTGEQIVGASVWLKDNSQCKATTGLDGSFTINVGTEGGTLVCSCLGYQTGEYVVS